MVSVTDPPESVRESRSPPELPVMSPLYDLIRMVPGGEATEALACTQVALRSTFDAGSQVVEFGGRLVGPPASTQIVPPPSVVSARPLAVMKPPPVAVTLPLMDLTVTRPAGAWLAYCRAFSA